MALPRLCLIHVPKAAGTAVRDRLRGIYPEADTFDRPYTVHFDEVDDATLAGYRLYLGHISVAYARERLPADTRLVTVLREPVERVLSQYFFTKETAEQSLREDLLAPGQRAAMELLVERGLVDYLQTDHPNVRASTRNQQLRVLVGKEAMRVVFKRTDEVIEQALATLDDFLAYGVQELLPFFGYELSRALAVPHQPFAATNVNESKADAVGSLPEGELDLARTLITRWNRPEIRLYEEVRRRILDRVNDVFAGDIVP